MKINNYDQYFPIYNNVNAYGVIRQSTEDFKVTEINTIDFTGNGEHLWLYLQKTDSNTDWVAKQLAKICQIPPSQVGYAGLKDRQAVTTQWFSIQLPKVNETEQIQAALPEELLILKSCRHNKKLKTGGLKGNHFKLLIRNIQGDKQAIEKNIDQLVKQGVPNYFGSQRFGHNMGNVQRAIDWFDGKFRPKNRNLKSLLLSTARSWIFNHIVAERIKTGHWLKPLPGDIYQLDGSHSWFLDDSEKAQIIKRLKSQDIHITAALWGEDSLQSQADTAILEKTIANRFPEILIGMSQHRLKHDRRACRITVADLEYQWLKENLQIQFTLGAGSYATAVLREIINTSSNR